MTSGPNDSQLERFLDEFERAWRNSDPIDIPRVLDRWRASRPESSPDPAVEMRLLAELIKLDLEYRWRKGSDAVHRPPPGTLLGSYLSRYPDLKLYPERLGELVLEEFRARLRWGDAPDPADYVQRFGAAVPNLGEEFRKIHQEVEVESSIRDLFRRRSPEDEFDEAGRGAPESVPRRLQRFLAQTPPFSELPEDVRRRMSEQLREQNFEADEYLMRQGDEAESLLIVLEGVAQIALAEPGGGEREIARVGRHALLGEMGLLTREVRSANVRAITPVKAAVLTREPFQQLVREFPTLTVMLSELIAQRVGTIAVDVMYGKTIDGYRIRQRLGRGSMGIVYLAEDLDRGREVAIKMLRHDLVYDRQATKRFVREAEVIRGLRHPNIIRVYREFAAYNTMFLSMEYCPGVNLSDAIRDRAPFPHELTRRIIGQLAAALACAHAAGVIHRDLKPANVMLATDGTVKLTDFGLARSVQSLTLTAQGQLLGTPRYMPAELLSGGEADERADVYGLGCIAWELIVGKPLFPARDMVELLRQQIRWELPSREEIAADLPEDLYAVLKESLSQIPAERTLDLKSLVAWAAPLPPSLTIEVVPESAGASSDADSTEFRAPH